MGNPFAVHDQKTADLTELVGTQLFKQVSMAQVAAPLRYCPAMILTGGDRLIVPGQTVDKIYVLLQGRLQVFDDEASGKPVGLIHQGECVGLSSFVDRQPCHVSIVSEGISRLLVLDEERLLALVNTPTAVSRNLLFMLMTYLRNKAARAPEPAAPVVTAPAPHNHIDAVTGLHNQRWLDETLERLILRAATDRVPLSLVAVELCDFPGLTEQYGQEMLDLSLREIARTLSNTVRPTDLIARHSTGRFVIMLPDTDQQGAEAAVTRIQETVNCTEIVIPGVCVLPPMPVGAGCVQMKAFVSGRKLVDDAFAALDQNLAILQAIRTMPAPEEPAESEPTVSTDSVVDMLETPTTDAIEPANADMLAVAPDPVLPDDATSAVSTDTLDALSMDAFVSHTESGEVPAIPPETTAADSDAVQADTQSEEPPRLPG